MSSISVSRMLGRHPLTIEVIGSDDMAIDTAAVAAAITQANQPENIGSTIRLTGIFHLGDSDQVQDTPLGSITQPVTIEGAPGSLIKYSYNARRPDNPRLTGQATDSMRYFPQTQGGQGLFQVTGPAWDRGQAAIPANISVGDNSFDGSAMETAGYLPLPNDYVLFEQGTPGAVTDVNAASEALKVARVDGSKRVWFNSKFASSYTTADGATSASQGWDGTVRTTIRNLTFQNQEHTQQAAAFRAAILRTWSDSAGFFSTKSITATLANTANAGQQLIELSTPPEKLHFQVGDKITVGSETVYVTDVDGQTGNFIEVTASINNETTPLASTHPGGTEVNFVVGADGCVHQPAGFSAPSVFICQTDHNAAANLEPGTAGGAAHWRHEPQYHTSFPIHLSRVSNFLVENIRVLDNGPGGLNIGECVNGQIRNFIVDSMWAGSHYSQAGFNLSGNNTDIRYNNIKCTQGYHCFTTNGAIPQVQRNTNVVLDGVDFANTSGGCLDTHASGHGTIFRNIHLDSGTKTTSPPSGGEWGDVPSATLGPDTMIPRMNQAGSANAYAIYMRAKDCIIENGIVRGRGFNASNEVRTQGIDAELTYADGIVLRNLEFRDQATTAIQFNTNDIRIENCSFFSENPTEHTLATSNVLTISAPNQGAPWDNHPNHRTECERARIIGNAFHNPRSNGISISGSGHTVSYNVVREAYDSYIINSTDTDFTFNSAVNYTAGREPFTFNQTPRGVSTNYPIATTEGVGGGRALPERAMVFNGTNQYVSFNDSLFGQLTDQFTISFWFKSTSTTSGDQRLVCNRGGSGATEGIDLYWRQQDEQLRLYTQGTTVASPTDVLPSDRWHFIVYRHDSAGGTSDLFVNGVSSGGFVLPVATSFNTLLVGRYAPSAISFLDAELCALRIYLRVLDDDMVQTVMRDPASEAPDVAYVEDFGDWVNQLGISGRDGTMNGDSFNTRLTNGATISSGLPQRTI